MGILRLIAEIIGIFVLGAVLLALWEVWGRRVMEPVLDLPIFWRLSFHRRRIGRFLATHRPIQIGLGASAILMQAAVFYLDRHPSASLLVREWALRQLQHPGRIALFVTPAVVISGKLASFWKRNALRSYGISEVVFGTLLGFNTVYIAPKLDWSRLVTLGSAIYVVSRGFNNIADSLEDGHDTGKNNPSLR